MFELQVHARTRDTREFVAHLHGGQWVGDECVFEFEIPDYGLAGLIRCDWREECPRFDLSDGLPNDEARVGALQFLSRQLRAFHSGAFAEITDAELEAMYDASYHEDTSYSAGLEREQKRKRHMAELVCSTLHPRKVLVAGCSAGETVRQLRQVGVEAWGFDLCPELADIAYEEVRPFVRQGSITDIPFDAADGFDTLTAFDLLEHVPEDRVDRVVQELERLQLSHLATLIAHCEFSYTGHVTLRPLSWWDARLAPSFVRMPTGARGPSWPSVDQSHRATSLIRFWQRTRATAPAVTIS